MSPNREEPAAGIILATPKGIVNNRRAIRLFFLAFADNRIYIPLRFPTL
jgi:hypothetical protein